MSKLLPCPFCNSRGVELGLLSSSHGGIRVWNVRCYVCCVETAYQCGSEQAIAAWNRRAQPSAEPVALRHLACIEDGELRMMTGYKIPPHDCELYAMPDGKAAPALYAHPPTDSAALRDAAIADLVRRKLVSAEPFGRCTITAAEIEAIAQHGEQSDG